MMLFMIDELFMNAYVDKYDVVYDWWFMIWMYMSMNMMLYDVVRDWWIIIWMYMLIKDENCWLDDLCCWLLWNNYYEEDVLHESYCCLYYASCCYWCYYEFKLIYVTVSVVIVY